MKGDGGILGRHEDVRLNKIKILELSKVLKEAGIVPGEEVILVGDGSNITNVNNFTNLTPMPEVVGGLEVGTSFDNVLITDLLNGLLYPYQYPEFTSFELNAYQDSSYEVGYTISGNILFSWSTINYSNIAPNTIVIYGQGITTQNNLPNTGSVSIPIVDTTRLTPGTRAWVILCDHLGKDSGSSRNNSIRWDFLMYYGSSTQTSLTEAEIKSLQNSNLTAGNSGTTGEFTFNTVGYKYFVFADDNSYTKPSSFVDVDTGFSVGMYSGFNNTENGYSYDLVSVTNQYNIAQNYRVYRTQNQLSGVLNAKIN